MTSDLNELVRFISSDLIMGTVPEFSLRAINDPILFAQLWTLVKRREPKISWRSAWILDHATEENPDLLKPILKEIYNELNTTGNAFDGTVRHLLKFVLRHPVLEDEGGYLIDKCMTWLMSNDVPAAIRANSADYLYNIYVLMPEFKNELASVFDANIEKGCSPGLLNKLKKLRAKLN